MITCVVFRELSRCDNVCGFQGAIKVDVMTCVVFRELLK